MLKKLKYVLLFICIYLITPISYCNKDLKPYVKEIMDLTNTYCKPSQYNNPKHVYYFFRKLPKNMIGYCDDQINGFSIVIHPLYWQRATDADKFQLIAHELSHCLLSKEHVDNKWNYMYPSLYPLSREVVTQQYIENLRSVCVN